MVLTTAMASVALTPTGPSTAKYETLANKYIAVTIGKDR